MEIKFKCSECKNEWSTYQLTEDIPKCPTCGHTVELLDMNNLKEKEMNNDKNITP